MLIGLDCPLHLPPTVLQLQDLAISLPAGRQGSTKLSATTPDNYRDDTKHNTDSYRYHLTTEPPIFCSCCYVHTFLVHRVICPIRNSNGKRTSIVCPLSQCCSSSLCNLSIGLCPFSFIKCLTADQVFK